MRGWRHLVSCVLISKIIPSSNEVPYGENQTVANVYARVLRLFSPLIFWTHHLYPQLSTSNNIGVFKEDWFNTSSKDLILIELLPSPCQELNNCLTVRILSHHFFHLYYIFYRCLLCPAVLRLYKPHTLGPLGAGGATEALGIPLPTLTRGLALSAGRADPQGGCLRGVFPLTSFLILFQSLFGQLNPSSNFRFIMFHATGYVPSLLSSISHKPVHFDDGIIFVFYLRSHYCINSSSLISQRRFVGIRYKGCALLPSCPSADLTPLMAFITMLRDIIFSSAEPGSTLINDD